jgi:hypothetical protein
MALLAAPAAFGEGSTVMCKAAEAPCAAANKFTFLHSELKAVPFKLLTSFGTIACEKSRLLGELGDLAEPQPLVLSSITFTGCTLGMTGCSLTAPTTGTIGLLRESANGGTATFTGTEVRVKCSGFTDCVYGENPVLRLAGKIDPPFVEQANISASEVPLPHISGLLCPKETKMDAVYEFLAPEPLYVKS